MVYIVTSGGSRKCQASTQSASLNGVLGAEPPVGSRGRAPGGVWGKLFVHFHSKKWPKFKDLNENLAQGLMQTASHSHDQS